MAVSAAQLRARRIGRKRATLRKKDRSISSPISKKKKEGMNRDLKLRQSRRRQQRRTVGRRPSRRSVEVTQARNKALLAEKGSGSKNTRTSQRPAKRSARLTQANYRALLRRSGSGSRNTRATQRATRKRRR